MAGTGLLWTMAGGVPVSKLLAQAVKPGAGVGKAEDFSFVQISDSHIGFNKGANPDVTGTLQKAIDKINVVPAGMKAPDFMIHTGDITQNSKASVTPKSGWLREMLRSEIPFRVRVGQRVINWRPNLLH
jgi:3',5'-cyclic-AMP phosphodiesterase